MWLILLKLLPALFSLIESIVQGARDRKLFEAGAAEAILKVTKNAQEIIAKAKAIRQRVRDELRAHPERVRKSDKHEWPD